MKQKVQNKDSQKMSQQDTIIDVAEPKRIPTVMSWKYIGLEIIPILLGVVGAAGAAIIPCIVVYVFGSVLDNIASNPSRVNTGSEIMSAAMAVLAKAKVTSLVNSFALQVTLIGIGALVTYTLWHGMMTVAHGRIGAKLKKTYFSALLDQEIGFFDMKKTGQLLSDLSESMELIQDTYTTKIGELANVIVQLLFSVVMALFLEWKIALVMMSIIPLFVLVATVSGASVGLFQRNINSIIGSAAGISNEVVSAIRTVRSMDGEEAEKKKFQQELEKGDIWIAAKGLFHGANIGISMFLSWACVALGFWYGGSLLTESEITFGNLFQILLYLLLGFMCVSSSLTLITSFGKSDQAMLSLMKVIRRTPRMRPSGGLHLEKIVGHIEFKNVSFTYPTRPNLRVLRDFNLTILPGQSVALVGASGSGKSTIVGLLEKFYEPESGEILLDGTNLTEIDPRWMHRNIGIVTQEPTLFATTIRENILYAVKHSGRTVTEEEIINAAKAANAHEFISALPNGYNTVIGERGVSMSGGQKQRIAIARAMIQDPKVMLLDEATSALDTQSESIVQEALDKLMIGRTCIIIAHRLSTVIDCDVICVMKKGKLREKGTHTELMKIENGHYFNLASRQMMIASGPAKGDTSTDSDFDDE